MGWSGSGSMWCCCAVCILVPCTCLMLCTLAALPRKPLATMCMYPSPSLPSMLALPLPADAARLRDQAAVSAVGWWVGRGNGDPCGHLLRITPDFSRYVGQVYSPRDLTELMPVRAVLFR